MVGAATLWTPSVLWLPLGCGILGGHRRCTLSLCCVLWDACGPTMVSMSGPHIESFLLPPQLSVHWFSQLFHKALHWEAAWSFGCFPWDAMGLSRTMRLFKVHGPDAVIPPFWRQLNVEFLSSFVTSWAIPSEPQNRIFCLGSPLNFSEVSIFPSSSWD